MTGDRSFLINLQKCDAEKVLSEIVEKEELLEKTIFIWMG